MHYILQKSLSSVVSQGTSDDFYWLHPEVMRFRMISYHLFILLKLFRNINSSGRINFKKTLLLLLTYKAKLTTASRNKVSKIRQQNCTVLEQCHSGKDLWRNPHSRRPNACEDDVGKYSPKYLLLCRQDNSDLWESSRLRKVVPE